MSGPSTSATGVNCDSRRLEKVKKALGKLEMWSREIESLGAAELDMEDEGRVDAHMDKLTKYQGGFEKVRKGLEKKFSKELRQLQQEGYPQAEGILDPRRDHVQQPIRLNEKPGLTTKYEILDRLLRALFVDKAKEQRKAKRGYSADASRNNYTEIFHIPTKDEAEKLVEEAKKMGPNMTESNDELVYRVIKVARDAVNFRRRGDYLQHLEDIVGNTAEQTISIHQDPADEDGDLDKKLAENQELSEKTLTEEEEKWHKKAEELVAAGKEDDSDDVGKDSDEDSTPSSVANAEEIWLGSDEEDKETKAPSPPPQTPVKARKSINGGGSCSPPSKKAREKDSVEVCEDDQVIVLD